MIIRTKSHLWDIAFAMRGSVLPHIVWPLLGLVLVTTLMVTAGSLVSSLPSVDATPFTVFGVALSLFLEFRNNAAYDRWWEARKLWGGLLGDLRALTREVDVFVPDAPRRTAMLETALAFLHRHRSNLRRLTPDAGSAALTHPFGSAAHPTNAALDHMGRLLAEGRARGAIDGFRARALSARLGSIALKQAGCERIAGTPLPYVYSLLIYRTTYLYCLLLPLALVDAAGWLTPAFVGIAAYVFLGLAEVSEELSQPFFGDGFNALPLDAICRTAEISLAPHLGRRMPPPQDFSLI